MSDGSAQVNGPTSPTGKYIDTIDPDDPEYQRQMRRPAEVKEDVKQMENRSRVSVILNSQAFREELEQIVEEQLASGSHPASLIALQQISDLLLPHSRSNLGSMAKGASPVIPVNDIRGVDSMNYTKGEKVLRCKLASLYRLVDMNGWTHGIYNHISVRVSQESEHFLLNPFGLLYPEVTASTLVKVDMKGNLVDPGSTTFGVNKAGFVLHSAIHQARPDIKCIIHLHTPNVVAVSAMKCGLLPLSQESLICGNISTHEYTGILVDQEERDKLARNLGPTNKVMLLRNHGMVACGETMEEAYHYAFNLVAACDTQMRAAPAGLDNLVLVDDETRKETFKVASQGGGGVDVTGRRWKTGELEFEALMRQLDNAGFRTGHVYKMPILKQEKKERSNSDVEVPPSSSSFTYVFDGDIEHSKYASPLKTALERQKQAYKAGWLTSPNTYKRQELEEIGTTNPKKYTKWVPEGTDSPSKTSTPIKVDGPNQFAPQGDNPKELKLKQKQIRKDYYEDKVSAGPQSKVLEGMSFDEAQKMKDGNLSNASDHVIVVGAASKGIIQRDHQHNAVVYRSYYAANPFENMSEKELEEYQKGVNKQEAGDDLSPGPDGRLISSEERMQQLNSTSAEESGIAPLPEETNLDESVNGQPESLPSNNESDEKRTTQIKRSESERQPMKSPEMIRELEKKNLERSKSDRQPREGGEGEKPSSPAKSDTLRSTDSASGGDTLEERSSKEGSPTKEQPSPKKEKKKKKFRMPSFSKKKNKESKESAI
ncbi:gamma-adducin-like isoform X4 [Haliotis asinina]|uniref:gamma-adducin-like isoform X4 n=1 Tax=Haliotis asinina TaxID=109174 RepID=UPI003531A8F3